MPQMTMVRLPPEEPLQVWVDVHKCENYKPIGRDTDGRTSETEDEQMECRMQNLKATATGCDMCRPPTLFHTLLHAAQPEAVPGVLIALPWETLGVPEHGTPRIS